jgi:tRNA(Glu) U13 pseudouridine synthase TruD
VEVEQEPGAIVLRFFLPSGAYATMVLREVCKPDLEDVLDPAES